MNSNRRYVIIAPCRDEAKFCRKTIDSVIAQSVRPALFVIVDDGSTDETPQILAEYAACHDWIKVIRRTDRGERAVGPGVIEAFYAGFATINLDDFNYLCKLDLDLILPERYFETLMTRMEENPRLGNCSGKPYYTGPDGELISEGCGDENAIGASKFYRADCFKEIGGFVRQVMWDGIDGHRCRMLGWIARSWDEPDIRFIHLRPMGSSHKGILTGRMRHGFGQYFMGTSLAYMTVSAIYRLTRPPVLVGGAAMWWGFARSMIRGVPQYGEPEFRKFLRRFQWACLIKGKTKATALLNERQAAAWKTRRAAALAAKLSPAFPPADVPLTPATSQVTIGGVRIDNLTMIETIRQIEHLIRRGEPGYVITPNVDHVVQFQRNEQLREAYRHASLVLPDGMPLLWASRFLKMPLKSKVSGSDLFPAFCEVAAQKGYRVFFLGGRPGAADRAAEILRTQYPGLQVATHCPPMGFDRDEAANHRAIERVRAFDPHVVFVGLGAPKQELWMLRHHKDYGAPVSIGVGASFDFTAGIVRRAPKIMQKTGFEWAWRLAQEPRRLSRRYLVDDPHFFSLVWRQKRDAGAFNHFRHSDSSAFADGPKNTPESVLR